MPQPTAPTYLRPAIATALVSIFSGLLLTCALVALGLRGNPADSFARVLEGGVRAWLFSHGAGLTVGELQINAIPLGATALAVGIVAWVAGKCLDEPLEESGPFVAVTAGTYAVLAVVLSVVTSSDEFSTDMMRAVAGAVVVSVTGAALGAARHNGGLSTLWFTENADVRAIVPAAWSGVIVLLGSALGLYVLMFVLNVERASDLWASLDPGFGGGLALAATCALVLPNLVLWAASTLLGPGFVLGTDTSVDLTGAHLGAVPGLPLLAALPGPGEFPGWIFLLGLLPLAAGGVAGWKLKTSDGRPLLERVALGAAAGALAGLACGMLIAVSGGAIGPGRMADAGPPHVTPALVAVGILALGGAIGAGLGHYRVARAHNSPSGRPRFWRRHKSPSAD